jgi:WD40 repeat protein
MDWLGEVDGWVRAASCTPDGGVFAVGTDRGAVMLCEVEAASGAITLGAVLEAHDGGVVSLAWHPARRLLASAGEDGQVALWGGEAELVGRWSAPAGAWLGPLCWDPRGELLGVAAGRHVVLLDASGELVAMSERHASTVVGLGWRPDGSSLAAACYGGLRLWRRDAQTCEELEWKGSFLSVAWRPDGSVVASGCQDSSVHFWRIETGKDSQMSGYPAKPDVLDWSAHGRWLATGGADVVMVWSFDGPGPEGREPIVLSGHQGRISALAFSRDDVLLSGGRDATVLAWRVSEGSSETPEYGVKIRGEVTAITWLDPARSRALVTSSEGELLVLKLH